jgi:hypothetical protein
MKPRDEKDREVEYPFVIHGAPIYEEQQYPTHTHGLTEVGWPELFIDPLAFGPVGNARLINAIYRCLSEPKYRPKLEAVLNGQIVEITDEDLFPGCVSDKACTYCLREAPRSFEGVRLAYPNQDEVSISMRVAQIWVKGDDFVLMDEYFNGGVWW